MNIGGRVSLVPGPFRSCRVSLVPCPLWSGRVSRVVEYPWGMASGDSVCPTPREWSLLRRSACILLECVLVYQ